MALMQYKSDAVIHTASGTAFSFKQGVSRNIPAQFVDEFKDKGCWVPEEPRQEVSDTSLDDVLNLLIEEGDVDNFKADGTPKINVVISLLGRKISAKEVYARFRELMLDDHNGTDKSI